MYMAHDYVYIFWAVVSVCWLSKLCPDPHGFVIMFLSSPNSDSAAWGCQQTRCQVFGSNNAWHGFSQSTMQSLSRLSLHCIFRSSWILVLMEVMLQTTSKSLVLFPVVYRGVRRKKHPLGFCHVWRTRHIHILRIGGRGQVWWSDMRGGMIPPTN